MKFRMDSAQSLVREQGLGNLGVKVKLCMTMMQLLLEWIGWAGARGWRKRLAQEAQARSCRNAWKASAEWPSMSM